MTLPIGTEVTYQGVRHIIIGYSADGWYKIRPVGSTSTSYNTVSGKYFTDIVEPPSEEDQSITIPGQPLDLCEGVVCDPECVGVDKYETVCDEGVCIRGVLIESNSVECGAVAKGDITNVTWEACHSDPRAGGCRSDIAYWGADVHVSTTFTNVGTAIGRFRIRLKDVTDAILAESDYESIDAGGSRIHKTTFVMPQVQSLALKCELRREVIL